MKAILDTNLLVAESLPHRDFEVAVSSADAYETVCGLVLAGGREVRGRAIDLMIAATAAVRGAVVITRNPDDFIGLDGLVTVVSA